MAKGITPEKELKIRNIKTEWTKISPILQKVSGKKTPVQIDMSKVESIDGAGLQLILLLLNNIEGFPEKYILKGLSDKIKQTSEIYGYNIHKNEVVK